MISISGSTVKIPNEFTPSRMDIVEAERNSKGTMTIEHIATKWKLTLKWNYLTQEEMSSIISAINPITFSVSFPAPTGGTVSGTFYKGDINTPMLSYTNGVAKWKDFSINLIEV